MVEWIKRTFLSSIKKTSHIIYYDKLKQNVFSTVNRVLLGDSTYITLPVSLAKFFGSSKNQTNKKTAKLKIQAVIDILKEQFCSFDITPYNKNDQKAAIDILDIAQHYDLIIRDLGYFTLQLFKQFIIKKIFF